MNGMGVRMTYPCGECIVLGLCSKLCDKVENNVDELWKIMRRGNKCPDCGCQDIYESNPLQIDYKHMFSCFICSNCYSKFDVQISGRYVVRTKKCTPKFYKVLNMNEPSTTIPEFLRL